MTSCAACAIEVQDNAKFCYECGSPIAAQAPAEFEQVTVLFADVVHSMDIAATVGAERLREIMADLVGRSTSVVKRYGGTVDKFTGDGIMAVFGAPVALEDHAFRACLAALGLQDEAAQLAAEVARCDEVDLRLRVGLNSGSVIAGEIGSGALGYTAIGEQVGMAQRMESAAPAGGVMLSESTARLVENSTVLGDVQKVRIKGSPEPVPARRLLAVRDRRARPRSESTMVGRNWELNTLVGILDEVTDGAGYVVGVFGPAGIGKSRLVREAMAAAVERGVDVFTSFCESAASDVPFDALARLLRTCMGIDDLGAREARARLRDQSPDVAPEDRVLLDDLLGIRDPGVALPEIAPDARRRRLTALIIGASLANTKPSVYVIEDVHWVDEASESMLADFFAVIPQTPSLVLVTYRPEYRGALTRIPGAQTIGLRPLNNAQSSKLTTELLGGDPSVEGLAERVAARAAGNPFFAEEIVRDLAERGVLDGRPGDYRLHGEVGDVDVPATLQATIGARIDRLDPPAKNTLHAAAVIGSRFDAELLAALVDDADVKQLIDAELLDQVRFTAKPEYVFRHPLIRTVGYESQLKSDRAQLHRTLATAIEARGSAGENAALVAEHLEAAGDLHAAYRWHMRAGRWSADRDVGAMRSSWQRARQIADRLPDSDPERLALRITPRTRLAATAFRVGGDIADAGFGELRDLCAAAGDKRSLAIGMAGLGFALSMRGQFRDASLLAAELIELVESIDAPSLTISLSASAGLTMLETGGTSEGLRLAQRVIELADGDPTKGSLIGDSPLTVAIVMRAIARFCLGSAGWKDDFRDVLAMADAFEPATPTGMMWWVCVIAIPNGVLRPDENILRRTAEALASAEQSRDDLAVDLARMARGVALVYHHGPTRDDGLAVLGISDGHGSGQRGIYGSTQISAIVRAREMTRRGDPEGAVESLRRIVEDLFSARAALLIAPAAGALVEALLQRGGDGDLDEARTAIERLAAAPTDPGFVLYDIWTLRLRALLAQSCGDDKGYREYRDRYRAMAAELGFEGHMAWSDAME